MKLCTVLLFLFFSIFPTASESSTTRTDAFSQDTELPFSETDFLKNKATCENLGKIVRGEYETAAEFEARQIRMRSECDRFAAARVYFSKPAILRYNADKEIMEIHANLDGLDWHIYDNRNYRKDEALRIGSYDTFKSRNDELLPESKKKKKDENLVGIENFSSDYFDSYLNGIYTFWYQTNRQTRYRVPYSGSKGSIHEMVSNGRLTLASSFQADINKARRLKSIESSLKWKIYAEFTPQAKTYNIHKFELIDESTGTAIASFRSAVPSACPLVFGGGNNR